MVLLRVALQEFLLSASPLPTLSATSQGTAAFNASERLSSLRRFAVSVTPPDQLPSEARALYWLLAPRLPEILRYYSHSEGVGPLRDMYEHVATGGQIRPSAELRPNGSCGGEQAGQPSPREGLGIGNGTDSMNSTSVEEAREAGIGGANETVPVPVAATRVTIISEGEVECILLESLMTRGLELSLLRYGHEACECVFYDDEAVEGRFHTEALPREATVDEAAERVAKTRPDVVLFTAFREPLTQHLAMRRLAPIQVRQRTPYPSARLNTLSHPRGLCVCRCT